MPTLPINEINSQNRQRLDLGDIDSLAESLRIHGLIQPIVINQDKRLIAGGRRLAAAASLGWTEIDVVYRETLSADQLYILELEENIQRKEETWQEQVLHIKTIHQIKQRLNAIDSKTWGTRETGAMLSVSNAHISYCLTIAELLEAELDESKKPLPSARYWSESSLSSAYKLYLRDQEQADLMEMWKRQQAATAAIQPSEGDSFFEEETVALIPFEPSPEFDHEKESVRERYLSNPLNPPEQFESYYSDKLARAKAPTTIHISRRLFLADSIEFMLRGENSNRFDHIITDIPYGIDMDMLNQQNQHGGMTDIDTVAELHDVDYNRKLISDFFPAAFHVTKPKSFVITWCDQMLWQFMYDKAIAAGFAVQRWPITWVKTVAMNQCVGFNTTKNTEIAMICRKPGATLHWQPNTSVISCGKDDLCSELSHPFAKPFALWEFLAKLCSLEGHSILDPFAGHGSSVISMLRLNRNAFGIELDQSHYTHLLENVKRLHYLKLNPSSTFA